MALQITNVSSWHWVWKVWLSKGQNIKDSIFECEYIVNWMTDKMRRINIFFFYRFSRDVCSDLAVLWCVLYCYMFSICLFSILYTHLVNIRVFNRFKSVNCNCVWIWICFSIFLFLVGFCCCYFIAASVCVCGVGALLCILSNGLMLILLYMPKFQLNHSIIFCVIAFAGSFSLVLPFRCAYLYHLQWSFFFSVVHFIHYLCMCTLYCVSITKRSDG